MKTKEIPALIEAYAELRDQRLALQRETDDLKRQETQAQEALIQALKDANLSSAGGASHKVSVKQVDKPVAMDWESIYNYIAETDGWDLLQRRLGETAVKARWEDGIEIPGVGNYPVDKLTLSKA